MRRFQTIIRHPALAALFLSLAIAGCAKKNQGLDDYGANGMNGANGQYDANGMNGANGQYGKGNAKPGTTQDFTVNVGDRVLFDLDSSSIRADGQQILMRQAKWLQMYPKYAVTVEGHADERGTREYNIALGQRRAVAARDFLISQGIPASRMRTISYGKERPVAICDDISCWSQNRRAVTSIK